MRQIVRVDNAEHPWISMSNEEVLRSGQMIAVDPETGKEGLTLAAILLFGKRNTIASVLPIVFISFFVMKEAGVLFLVQRYYFWIR